MSATDGGAALQRRIAGATGSSHHPTVGCGALYGGRDSGAVIMGVFSFYSLIIDIITSNGYGFYGLGALGVGRRALGVGIDPLPPTPHL